jgi:hypothetical protein
MFNWDKAVDSHFDKKQDSKNELESLFESLLNQLKVELLTEASSESTQDAKGKFRLPPFKITQNWGQPDTLDRQRISKFMRNIEGQDIKEKLEFINSILSSEPNGKQTIPQILSTMVSLESLNSIVQEFEASSSGFLFESFVAALLGRGAKQIPGTKQIEDIEDVNGTLYSLKLIQKADPEGGTKWEKEGSSISGSFQNLVKLFSSGKSVHYIVALKQDKGGLITFGQFIMTPENFIDILTQTKNLVNQEFTNLSLRDVKRLISASNQGRSPFTSIRNIIDNEGVDILGDESGRRPSDISIEKLFDTLEDLNRLSPPFTIVGDLEIEQVKKYFSSGGREGSIENVPKIQFSISQKEMVKVATYEELGKLDLTEDSLKQLWIRNAELLEKTVAPIYRAFDQFSTNLESYLTSPTSEEGQTRKAYGEKAIQSSWTLAITTDKSITKMEKSRKDAESI